MVTPGLASLRSSTRERERERDHEKRALLKRLITLNRLIWHPKTCWYSDISLMESGLGHRCSNLSLWPLASIGHLQSRRECICCDQSGKQVGARNILGDRKPVEAPGWAEDGQKIINIWTHGFQKPICHMFPELVFLVFLVSRKKPDDNFYTQFLWVGGAHYLLVHQKSAHRPEFKLRLCHLMFTSTRRSVNGPKNDELSPWYVNLSKRLASLFILNTLRCSTFPRHLIMQIQDEWIFGGDISICILKVPGSARCIKHFLHVQSKHEIKIH